MLPIYAYLTLLSVQTYESIGSYRVFSFVKGSAIYPFLLKLLYHLSKQCRTISDIRSFSIGLVSTLDLHFFQISLYGC